MIEVIFIMTIVCNNIGARVVYGAVVSQVIGEGFVSWIKAGVG